MLNNALRKYMELEERPLEDIIRQVVRKELRAIA